MDTITTRTDAALESDLLDIIRKKRFCIVGCGAVGVAFAEMLVRTGAKKIGLIDGDKVEITNLNRVIGFLNGDIGQEKVTVLASHLKKINPCIEEPTAIACNFKEIFPGDNTAKEARDLVANSDIILIAMDNNDSRISCEKICRDFNKDYLSIGVRVDKGKKLAYYECTWKPETPIEKKEAEGYGPENGSFASIVLEAVAVGFNLMLHHLQNPGSAEYRRYEKEYLNFKPIDEKAPRELGFELFGIRFRWFRKKSPRAIYFATM